MNTSKKTLRICREGHEYYKSSDCAVCPICEKEKKYDKDFLSLLVAPARRALIGAGINTLEQLSEKSEEEILKLHGMGPGSIPKLRSALMAKGLSFRE